VVLPKLTSITLPESLTSMGGGGGGGLINMQRSHVNQTVRITHLNRGGVPSADAAVSHQSHCPNHSPQSSYDGCSLTTILFPNHSPLSRHRSILLCRMHPPPPCWHEIPRLPQLPTTAARARFWRRLTYRARLPPVVRVHAPDRILEQLGGRFSGYSTLVWLPSHMQAAPHATTPAAVELWLWWSPPQPSGRAAYYNAAPPTLLDGPWCGLSC
jgi:hypothetical protein